MKRRPNDSVFSTYLSYLYINEYLNMEHLKLEMLPIIALWGRRHYKVIITSGEDGVTDPLLRREAYRFNEHLRVSNKYCDQELRRARLEKGLMIDHKNCYVTETLLELLGFTNKKDTNLRIEFVYELAQVLRQETVRIKRNPENPKWEKRRVIEEDKFRQYEIHKKPVKIHTYVNTGMYQKLTPTNVHSLGSLSLMLCYGAACLKYFYSSGAFCRKLFAKQIPEIKNPYAFARVTRYLLNGSHEESWLAETSSDSQIGRIAEYMNDYLSLMMQYGHLHKTYLQKTNLAAMILSGLMFETKQKKQEKVKAISQEPIQMIITNPNPLPS